MMFDLDFAIELEPKWAQGWPCVSVGLDNLVLFSGPMSQTTHIHKNIDLSIGSHCLWVELSGKTDANSKEFEDQAVKINSVSFEGISSDRFLWLAKYTPQYPEPWASQQQDLKPIIVSTYLGWNGRWQLDFEVPIFTWIHRVEHLGWLYT